MSPTEARLAAAHRATADAYTLDCLAFAREIRASLAAEGRAATLLRVRQHERRVDGSVFVAPLTPLRYLGRGGPTWNTHYACRAGDRVFDALFAAPVALADYTRLAFGRDIPLEAID